MKANPVIQCLDRLKQLDPDTKDRIDQNDLDEVVELLDKLAELCGVEGSGNAAIATKNGGVELVCSVCLKIPTSGCERVFASALKTLALLLHGIVDLVVDISFCYD